MKDSSRLYGCFFAIAFRAKIDLVAISISYMLTEFFYRIDIRVFADALRKIQCGQICCFIWRHLQNLVVYRLGQSMQCSYRKIVLFFIDSTDDLRAKELKN